MSVTVKRHAQIGVNKERLPIKLKKYNPQEKKHCRLPHIGIVSSSFPVSGWSCSGIFVERLIASIAGKAQVTALVPSSNSDICRAESGNYRIEYFSYGPKKWQRLAHFPGGIPDAIRRRDPATLLLPLFILAMFIACLRLAGKVEILHGNWSVPALIAALAARIRGCPAIATLRGEDVNRLETSPMFLRIMKYVLMFNSYVVVVSEAMQLTLQNRFPSWADKIIFIPNGVSINNTSNPSAFRTPLRLLTVGSLIRRKQIETLLHAVAKLREYSDVKLRIVGAGPERDSLEKISGQLSISHQVDFSGSVPPEDIENHLAWADIFIFASESEGRPNAVLEAMAAALPIIATDIPGIRELLRTDAGLLYPVGNAQALANRIQALINDPDYARTVGRAAKERIRDFDLTWNNAAWQYISLYIQAKKYARKH